MEIKKVKIGDAIIFTPLELREKYKILLFFTAKRGGFSSGKYKSLNTAYHVGDDTDFVTKNRLKILKLFGYAKITGLISLNQMHSDKIVAINDNFLKENPGFINKPADFSKQNIPIVNSADGLITDISLLPIMVIGADCNLILMADIKKKVIAAVHAGWRGVLNQIVLNALNSLKEKYDSNLKDILIFIGPSIRKCCFKVTEDIFSLFYRKFKGKMAFKKYKDEIENIDYFFIDLVNIISDDLQKSGILKENISDIGLCTCCDKDNLFYSYRKEKITGRHAGVIMLD